MIDRLKDQVIYAHKMKFPRTIYLIKVGDFVKIGYTLDIKQRLSGYRVHSPYQYSLLCHAKTSEYKEFEKAIFNEYPHLLHHGEWFRYDDNMIQTVMSQWFK